MFLSCSSGSSALHASTFSSLWVNIAILSMCILTTLIGSNQQYRDFLLGLWVHSVINFAVDLILCYSGKHHKITLMLAFFHPHVAMCSSKLKCMFEVPAPELLMDAKKEYWYTKHHICGLQSPIFKNSKQFYWGWQQLYLWQ